MLVVDYIVRSYICDELFNLIGSYFPQIYWNQIFDNVINMFPEAQRFVHVNTYILARVRIGHFCQISKLHWDDRVRMQLLRIYLFILSLF